MYQGEVFPAYKKDILELSKSYDEIKSYFTDDGIEELCKLRGYTHDNPIRNVLKELNVGIADITDTSTLYRPLVTNSGRFILNNRFIIPMYDVSGNLCTLIGYYPDEKKYITVPMPFFSKECQFFNFHQAYKLAWEEYGGICFVVEGIFDCLSIRALGLPCVATMGSTVSKIKCELLRLFSKVVAIPDDDAVGRASLKRYTPKGWVLPDNATAIKLIGGSVSIDGNKLHCKDIDNLINWFDTTEIYDSLLEVVDSKEEIEVWDLSE